jgi:hypothetical protein
MCPCCESTLLWSFNPFHFSPSPLYLPSPFSTAFKTHPYILSLHRCYISQYCWCSVILFSSPPPWSSIEWSHYYKHVLCINFYMIVHGFVYMFIFWIYLPHMREHMWPVSFWACVAMPCFHFPPFVNSFSLWIFIHEFLHHFFLVL